MEEIEKFSERWSIPNHSMGPVYNPVTEECQNNLDAEFYPIISAKKARLQIQRMNVDSAPGPDGILVRWIKSTLKQSKIVIASLASYMVKFNFVPDFMQEARTVLIFKSGDPNDTKNWRPITVSSVIRRIVAKILDKDLRGYITLNDNQRGFSNQASTLINTTLINECLKKAIKTKSDCTVIFGDITQAFDNVGHAHTFRQIMSKPAPTPLKSITCNLATNNFTRISTIKGKTNKIHFERGVMQGDPL